MRREAVQRNGYVRGEVVMSVFAASGTATSALHPRWHHCTASWISWDAGHARHPSLRTWREASRDASLKDLRRALRRPRGGTRGTRYP